MAMFTLTVFEILLKGRSVLSPLPPNFNYCCQTLLCITEDNCSFQRKTRSKDKYNKVNFSKFYLNKDEIIKREWPKRMAQMLKSMF